MSHLFHCFMPWSRDYSKPSSQPPLSIPSVQWPLTSSWALKIASRLCLHYSTINNEQPNSGPDCSSSCLSDSQLDQSQYELNVKVWESLQFNINIIATVARCPRTSENHSALIQRQTQCFPYIHLTWTTKPDIQYVEKIMALLWDHLWELTTTN